AALWFFRVGIGASGEQGFDRPDAAGTGGGHERGLATGIWSVGVGTRVEEEVDHGGVAVGAGERERGNAVPGRDFGIGAGADEGLSSGNIVAPDRLMERVGVGGVQAEGEEDR